MSKITPLSAEWATEIPYMLTVAEREPWHMIALEAYQEHSWKDPQHRWFMETDSNNKLRGLIYVHQELIHFAYPQAPSKRSPLYAWLKRHFNSFTTYGSRAILEPIIKRLNGFKIANQEHHQFMVQTQKTEQALHKGSWLTPPDLLIRKAQRYDWAYLTHLLSSPELADVINRNHVQSLIDKQRVYLFISGHGIVGVMMSLKETQRYVLLGNLYIHPTYRRRGLASILCANVLKETVKSGKKACFYFDQQHLTSFYAQAYFQSIGQWSHYKLTSNPMMSVKG